MKLAHRAAFAALIAVLPLGGAAPAQDYPTRPITLIVPWGAGGAVDTAARFLAPKLSDRLGKPVVVENRPGAGSVIGTAAAAKAAPDGYTLGMPGSGSLAISATMYKKLPYDPIKDIVPVAFVAQVPFVLVVNPSLPARSVSELIQLAKERRGQLSYGSGGPGSPHHLYAVLFKSMTGIEMAHIPYKGSASAIADVVAGHVPILFSDPIPSLPLIRDGKVRALGVTTRQRWASAPDIPTIAEAGVPGFVAAGWFLISVPANTPDPIVKRLRSELATVLAASDTQEQIARLGLIPGETQSPQELVHFVSAEIERWGNVVRQAGLAGTE
jgi:tripartite-type tricarboxylate transporter receptor subunit TctC